VNAFRFYLLWFQLGRRYRETQRVISRTEELSTLKSWLMAITPAESVGDECAAWLAEQEDEDAA